MQGLVYSRDGQEGDTGPSVSSSRRSSSDASDACSIELEELFWRPLSAAEGKHVRVGVRGAGNGARHGSPDSSATSMSVHDAEHALQEAADAKEEENRPDKSNDRQSRLNGGALPGSPVTPKCSGLLGLNVMADGETLQQVNDRDIAIAVVDLGSSTSLATQDLRTDADTPLSPATSPAPSHPSTISLAGSTATATASASPPRGTITNFTTWGLSNPSRRSLVSLDSQQSPHRGSSSPSTPSYSVLLKDPQEDYLSVCSAGQDECSVSSTRRRGRKQPPNLTESLELIAAMSVSPRTATTRLPDVDAAEAVAHRASVEGMKMPMRVIEVDLPPLEPGSTIVMKVPANQAVTSEAGPSRVGIKQGSKSSEQPSSVPTRFEPIEHIAEQDRRKSSQPSIYSRISRRQSSLPALDPTAVRPNISTGPRFSLFPTSRGHKKILELQASRRPSQETGSSLPDSPESGVPGLSCSATATESTCGTWDMDEEPASVPMGIQGGKRIKESRKQRKLRQKAEKDRFDAVRPPDKRELFDASMLEVVDEKGEKVMFGELVRGQKTIVVFLRHWFCTMCAQYMKAMVRDVRPEALEEAGVKLIVIGNGSAKMIDGYAYKHFKSPFRTYTDPSLLLYRTLGLTRQTMDAGLDEDRGDYLTETAMEQTVATLKRATKMPLRNPGHFTQLGGEFVFDGPMKVIYTHRMINTRDHAPIRDVCAEAGVRLEHFHYEAGPPPPEVHRPSVPLDMHVHVADLGDEPAEGGGEVTLADPSDEYEDWKANRDATLAKMRKMKAMRSEGLVDLKHRAGNVVPAGTVKV